MALAQAADGSGGANFALLTDYATKPVGQRGFSCDFARF